MGLQRSWPWIQPLADLRRMLDLASSRRFRAAGRRPLRAAARRAMGIVVLASLVNCVWLLPGRPNDALAVGGANLLAAAFAIAAYAILRWRRQARVELVVLAILVAVDVATVVSGRVDLELERVSAGYGLLLPPIVALLVPWSTRIHLSWLGVHVALVAVGSTMAIPGSMLPEGPRALVGLLAIASALSLFGHLAGLHSRVDTFIKIQEMRSINRRARRADAALRLVNHDLALVARTDRLTGLGNRLALHEQLRLIRSRIGRYDERYALLLLDLDRFKGINDTLGHFAGDAILSRVARQMAQTTRDSDTAFRFGGEEFIVLLPLGPDEAMVGVADRIRLAIERLGIAHPANPPHHVVTVSIGATAIDRARLDESDEMWLHDADVALYRAKGHGRNRTEQARGRRGFPVVASAEPGAESPRSATATKT